MHAPRVLILASKRTYRLDDLVAAAAALGVRLTLATDRCHVLAQDWKDDVVTVEHLDAAACLPGIAQQHAKDPFVALVGSCDLTTELAAALSNTLGITSNPVNAAVLARHKGALREVLRAARVPSPAFHIFDLDEHGQAPLDQMCAVVPEVLGFPVVVKPLLLSGSRGVMRADDVTSLRAVTRRLCAILTDPELVASGEADHRRILVESYVDGVEVALEGLLEDGLLRVLALFDKPDPLVGPFFEETLYITPSRHPRTRQDAVVQATQAATAAMGLRQGPVHAELRITPDGRAVVLEVAARSIGGLCGRMLRFGTGKSLDEVVLASVLGLAPPVPRQDQAVGVMMLPVPKAGIFHGVTGVEQALQVPGVQEVTITAREHEELVPLPEGNSYLGFLFAQGSTPQDVEDALRTAFACLKVAVTSKLVAV